MDWFRMYAEARNDAKLRSLTDAQHRIWFNLLCYASEQPERGVIADYDLDLLALEVSSGDTDLLQATLERLGRLRIVTACPDAISFIHWLERQYDKPSDRPAAVRARVEKHRAAASNTPEPPPPNGVSRDMELVTPSNAAVTLSNAHTQNREYTEQIRSEETIPPTPQPGEAPSAPETGAVDNFSPWFDEFWALYPTRRGKKLNKAHARDRAKNLSSRDWDSVLQAVRNYANSDQGRRGVVEDAHRFLAHWQDWQDPEVEPVMQKGSTRDKPLYPTADERRSESYAAWGRIARGPDPAPADDPRQLGPDLRLVRQSIA